MNPTAATRGTRIAGMSLRAAAFVLTTLFAALLSAPRCGAQPASEPPVDDAPPAIGAPTPTPDPSLYGSWKVTTSVSPQDHTPVIKAVLEANAPVSSAGHSVIPVIVLRYRAGSIDAYAVFDLYLGDGNCPVSVKAGDDPATSQVWLLSDDGRAAFVPGDTLPFMKSLASATTFTLGVTPYHQLPVKAVFSPKGADRVLELLLKAAAKIPSGPDQ